MLCKFAGDGNRGAFANQTLFADGLYLSAAAQNVLGTCVFCLTGSSGRNETSKRR